MFIGTVWTLSNRRREQQQSVPGLLNVVSLMILVTVLLLLLSTAHIIINLYRLVVGLTLNAHGDPGGSSAFFINAARPSYVAKNSVYVVITLVADAVVVSFTPDCFDGQHFLNILTDLPLLCPMGLFLDHPYPRL
jgi:hypothetical protein